MSHCEHGNATNKICAHLFNASAKQYFKYYTGHKNSAYYLCERCIDTPEQPESLHSQCWYCFHQKFSTTEFQLINKPQSSPIKINWKRSCPQLPINYSIKILAASALKDSESILMVNAEKDLLKVNLNNGTTSKITRITELHIDSITRLQLIISDCQKYLAITALNREPASNEGLVINLISGERVFTLADYKYHSEETDYPIAFYIHQGQCCIIHASEWNRLDLTNLETKQCLTLRDINETSEAQRENALFTEWAGELKISPDGKRLATIGWVWHPLGLAWSFNLDDWIDSNKWEADFGNSKIDYAVWDYFWQSPFAWIDAERLIIWGDPETGSDIPEDTAAIYNGKTGEKLFSFPGPTLDVFEIHDEFLLSGNSAQDGISVWQFESGNVVDELYSTNKMLCYHQCISSFITLNKSNQIELIKWQLDHDTNTSN